MYSIALCGIIFITLYSIPSTFTFTKEQLWPHCEDPDTGYCSNNTSLPLCPDCSLVECIPNIDAEDCPEGTHWEDNVLWGCCPACTTRLEIDEACGYKDGDEPSDEYKGYEYDSTRELPCNIKIRQGNGESIRITSESWDVHPNNPDTFSIPIFHLYECGMDAKCLDNTCALSLNDDVKCSKDQLEYNKWDKKAAKDDDCSISSSTLTTDSPISSTTGSPSPDESGTKMEWDRQCTQKGRFSLVQSKSNRFKREDQICHDPNGNRIFGEGDLGDEDINCRCSRKRWEMEQTIKKNPDENVDQSIFDVRSDITLHCNEMGNFETIQCDNGFCWCMEPLNTGRLKATSKVLHENLREQLPCVGNSGRQYLRRCESRTTTKAKVKTTMLKHGLDWQEQKSVVVACDYDGSFAPVNYDTNGVLSCVDKIQQPIANFKKIQDMSSNMDCLCARSPKSLQCDAQGSYKEFQTFQDIKYCVDGDGFRKTRKYDYREDNECRIPKCECFSTKFPGCTHDSQEACRVCDENDTNCQECDPCPETDCN